MNIEKLNELTLKLAKLKKDFEDEVKYPEEYAVENAYKEIRKEFKEAGLPFEMTFDEFTEKVDIVCDESSSEEEYYEEDDYSYEEELSYDECED